MHKRKNAAFTATQNFFCQTEFKLRPVFQGIVEAHIFRAVCRHDDANFLWPNGGNISLDTASPINFHVLRPGKHSVVTAQSMSLSFSFRFVQTTPAANPGPATIGPDNPASRLESTGQNYPGMLDAKNRSFPEHTNTALFGFND